MTTIIDKIKAKIKRRKPYKTIAGVSNDIDNYIKTHNMNRKGADKRLEAYYDKTVNKYKNDKIKTKATKSEEPKRPRFVDVKSTPLQTGEEQTIKLGSRQLDQLEKLQAKANRMAREAGLDYNYDFHFGSKEGYKNYLSLLEKMTTDENYFNRLAEQKLNTFIETTKRMFEIYENTTTDKMLQEKYSEVIDKLNDKSTDFNEIYKKLKTKYDVSELSVYLFSSDVDQFELQSDSELIEIIDSILNE